MERSGSRLKILAFVVVFMFVALSTRLWFLQVLAGPQHARDARDNSLRTVTTDALRGDIVDREGRRLVHNRLSLEVRIKRDELGDEAEATLAHLSEILGVPAQDLGEQLDSNLYYSYQPVPVAEFVPEEVFFKVREEPERFRGVEVVEQSVRTYPQRALAAHLVGWVGQINAEEIERSPVRGLRAVGPRGQGGARGDLRAVVAGDSGAGAVPRELRRRGPPGVRSEPSRARSRPAAGARSRCAADRRGGAPQGHRERTHGLRRELGEEPGRERRRRRGPRPEDGRHRRDGILAVVLAVVVRQGAHGDAAVPAVRELAGADAEPRDTDHVRARLDVQAVRGARGRQGRDRAARRLLRLSGRVRARERRVRHGLPQLERSERRRADDRRWTEGLVRHPVLQVRERLLLPRREHERRGAAASAPAVGVRPRNRRRPAGRGGRHGAGPGIRPGAPRRVPGRLDPRRRHPALDRRGGHEGDAAAARAGVRGDREREALPAASRGQHRGSRREGRAEDRRPMPSGRLHGGRARVHPRGAPGRHERRDGVLGVLPVHPRRFRQDRDGGTTALPGHVVVRRHRAVARSGVRGGGHRGAGWLRRRDRRADRAEHHEPDLSHAV